MLRKEFINILSVRKDKSPLKPGTLLKRYFTKRGKEPVKALSDILDINLANTRKLIHHSKNVIIIRSGKSLRILI